ncbi:unnamed protein product [Prorocentrum cordatum]|uniref:Uncharacterized protein n=1 Tax=Prorocentrum cordatum TaxID=2364126 RepID=A0ABN9T6Y5_9DINO|nr:unnamed protein product [Polarella glacialis]
MSWLLSAPQCRRAPKIPVGRLALAAALCLGLSRGGDEGATGEVDAAGLRGTEAALVAGVLDGRSFYVFGKGASKLKKQRWQVAGVVLRDGGAGEAEGALRALVDKRRVYVRALPEEVQAMPADGAEEGAEALLADVWDADGRHLGRLLVEGGSASAELDPSAPRSELFGRDARPSALGEAAARSAEEAQERAAAEKEEAMKEIADAAGKVFEDAAVEREARQREAAAKAAEEAEGAPGGGAALCAGAGVALAIVACAAANFGRPTSKKVNLNRKRGWLEQQLRKLKGS